jgi:hypothetical protein
VVVFLLADVTIRSRLNILKAIHCPDFTVTRDISISALFALLLSPHFQHLALFSSVPPCSTDIHSLIMDSYMQYSFKYNQQDATLYNILDAVFTVLELLMMGGETARNT